MMLQIAMHPDKSLFVGDVISNDVLIHAEPT